MKATEYFIPTIKENPGDAECKSHRLMIRGGFVRRLASGTYSFLPMGQRVLLKIEKVIREEMNRIGALEVLLPAIHPLELWVESGRRDILGQDLIQFKDRHGRQNVLGPTHEEVITDLVRKELSSYKQLPLTLYQIQTKFRDELRPRSGVIRCREFIMKDAYSFHVDEKSLEKTYKAMRQAYETIFKRLGLKAFIVEADPGAMGGGTSHEFVSFSSAGEDCVVQLGDSSKVVSQEMASRKLGSKKPDLRHKGKIQTVHTPGERSIAQVAKTLEKKPKDLVKTMIYEASQVNGKHSKVEAFAVLVRGDHEVSDYKVKKSIHPGAKLASAETIERLGSAFGYSGPTGLKNVPLYLDEDVLDMKDFVTGANRKDYHLTGVNLADIYAGAEPRIQVGDFRVVIEGDRAEKTGDKLQVKEAIELGHIFKLNLRYSEPMKAHFKTEKGKELPVFMGCYGIGVSRLMAAAVEQLSDDKGIVWPSLAISPFEVVLILVNTEDRPSVDAANRLYGELQKEGIDALYDDRSVSAGIKFNDADLIGIPLQIIVGPKNLKNKQLELKIRHGHKRQLIDADQPLSSLHQALKSLR